MALGVGPAVEIGLGVTFGTGANGLPQAARRRTVATSRAVRGIGA
jgi:hypothetical protein